MPDLHYDGTVKGEYVVGHDITDLKQAQDALAAREGQLRAIMDGVPAPVAYIDRDERCHYVNRTFLQFFGLDAGAGLRRCACATSSATASTRARRRCSTRAMEGESTAFDRLVPGANGVRRWMTIRVVPDASPTGDVHGAFVLMNDIHGLKQAQEALRDSEAALRLIMDNVPARVSYIDRDYRYRFLNRHNEEWLGESRKDLTGRTFAEVVGNERASQLGPLLDRVLKGETVSTEKQLVQPDGAERWESVHYAPHRDAEGNVVGIYAVHADIHDQKRNEDDLKRANWMLSSHISNTPLAVLEWDRDFRLVRWSPQAENIFGWKSDEILGIPLADSPLVHEEDREAFAGLVDAPHERRGAARDGPYAQSPPRRRHDLVRVVPLRAASTTTARSSRSCRSCRMCRRASRRKSGCSTSRRATRSPGCPTGCCCTSGCAQAIAQAKRSGHRVGVLFIDLDRFKNVNDTLGHRIGDELLKRVTASLSGALRETDLLARLGGDEFMVIVEDFDDPAVLGRIAQKLLDAIAQPFEIEGHDIYVTSSIGIAVYPDDSDDPEELLKYADVAMYRSKDLGRNTYQFLDANLAEDRLRQHTLETALRNALNENALKLHYQPVLRVSDRTIVGCRGAPALERSRSTATCRRRCSSRSRRSRASSTRSASGCCAPRRASASTWRKAGLKLNVSVNLSARQFYREDLAQRISEIVKAEECDPSWIELEVTETSLLHDLDAIRKVLHQLRDEGFTVAIDDFGTGYSSLTHLKHFPIDTLKIDISFIADLESDPQDAAITEAIIGLARGLGLKVVAEGVGTREQLEFLDVRGCDCFQGFWASKPLSADAFYDFVRLKSVGRVTS